MKTQATLGCQAIPTYPIGEPEKNPLFFEKRVYQGSSGKVYPVPFVDKVFDQPQDVTYQIARLENDFVRLEMMPEIGGRIWLGQDKTNNDFDFFYRQDVVKPALVGLAGPWISGGVEFNWPQHHRPGTFMPADVHIEEESDGSQTVWMSEHDPLNRLKGMHGVRLRPDSSLIELKARLYNRTPLTHTFLWWANVAARVHDQYQSFLPPDVHYVADHAVRAMSSFPVANTDYYGVDYHNRPGANDLSWYKNIPVPTSYMICETGLDFFGGYDHAAGGGFVHVANRHIAPGKKQWTWGNERFGWTWDRELTDQGGPYVELMAGVYTDNQPDFSYLLPYETKTFSQFWWPIQDIGPVQQANCDAALAFRVRSDRQIELGVCVSSAFEGELTVREGDRVLEQTQINLQPGQSWQNSELQFQGDQVSNLLAELRSAGGELVLDHRPIDPATVPTRNRQVATEPPAPEDVASVDELFHIGSHLEQYRHPTRSPGPYWQEGLRRDPGDYRCHLALGKRLLQRGQYEAAGEHLQSAVARLTSLHPNPETGEAHYYLGLTLRALGNVQDAYAALYKSTWNYEWRSAAYYQLATLDCLRADWSSACDHLNASLDTNRQHNKASLLLALAQAQLAQQRGESSDTAESRKQVQQVLSVDPLDHWAYHLLTVFACDSGSAEIEQFLAKTRNDAQTILDLAFDYIESGFYQHAIDLIELHHANEVTPVAVPNPLERSAMTHYVLAWLKHRTNAADAGEALNRARGQSADHCFPSRLEEMDVLQWAMEQPGSDPLAAYALGNLLLDKRRHQDAIDVWQVAAKQESSVPQVYRNLGIAIWNHSADGQQASAYYQQAMDLDPQDARLVSEFDQLSKKRNIAIEDRLGFLQSNRELVLLRDDATVELAALYNVTGNAKESLDLLLSRRFHPWEGGEGAVLRQYTSARLLLGKADLENGDAQSAHDHFTKAMETPDSLGEAYHPLQAQADVNYWIGRSLTAMGRDDEAVKHFQLSAEEEGDFSEMAVTQFSPLTYYRGLSMCELGQRDEAAALFTQLRQFANEKIGEPAKIDYFATSLPNLLVFDEELQCRRDAENHFLAALACHGLCQCSADEVETLMANAETHLKKVLEFDRSHQQANELAKQLESYSLENA
ncbi:Tetratricopeptide repeat protein [Crateriforma conspicua]|uniref:Tetratricopeptide repeat protein n=1 Tax=Crateriforma conspicua TaxID=2527996 RepID=A0A5C6FVZ8_9PLAN|nr:DUF5107 domain-containing protein [Crateriforma conspicua]TWU67099.1 Tetratricopeptide repeat protein [Crateriforma conspicua]